VFLGGAREPHLVEASTDEELLQLAKDEVKRFLGSLEDCTRFTQVFRWVRSNPQPTLGHAARLQVIEAEMRAFPQLALAGSAYDGVGLGDCIRQGRAAARRVLSGAAA
jgi:oxygen-dependent protoporphyrinogen oxidase